MKKKIKEVVDYKVIDKIVKDFADKMPYSKWHSELGLWEVYVYPQTIYMGDKLHDKYLNILNEIVTP